MAARLVVAFRRGCGEWCGPVEAGEASLAGEPPRVAHLHEQLRVGPFGDAAQPTERRARCGGEPAELGAGLAFAPVELGDAAGVLVEQPQPKQRRLVRHRCAIDAVEAAKPPPHVVTPPPVKKPPPPPPMIPKHEEHPIPKFEPKPPPAPPKKDKKP